MEDEYKKEAIKTNVAIKILEIGQYGKPTGVSRRTWNNVAELAAIVAYRFLNSKD